MKLGEMKEQILSNLIEAIVTHDDGVRTEYRISTSNSDDIIDFESNDSLMFYLPYKMNGHRIIGHLKLDIELEA